METDQFSHQVIVSCLIRDREERVLLVRHRKRGWELPQGKVEAGESVLTALAREVLEETGVEIDSAALAAVWSKLTPPAALILAFQARHAGGEPRPSEETPEVAWVEISGIFDLVVHPVNGDRIKSVLAFCGEPGFYAYSTGPYAVVP